MPAPQDEPADDLSLLQKQLILAQVQILELEDVRDELKTAIEERTRLLAELQTVADCALAETQQARTAEAAAQRSLNSSQDERQKLQLNLEALQRGMDIIGRQLVEVKTALSNAITSTAAHATRIESLDAELHKLKSSRSWRWTAPLRSIERRLI